MKKSRLTDEQIAYALRQVESGTRCDLFGFNIDVNAKWERLVTRSGMGEVCQVLEISVKTPGV
ncbi:MAG: hypothetical protein ACRD2L_05880 [Terriglobia bacterium]